MFHNVCLLEHHVRGRIDRQKEGADLIGVLKDVSILRDSQGCESSNLTPLLLELCAGTVKQQR